MPGPLRGVNGALYERGQLRLSHRPLSGSAREFLEVMVKALHGESGLTSLTGRRHKKDSLTRSPVTWRVLRHPGPGRPLAGPSFELVGWCV